MHAPGKATVAQIHAYTDIIDVRSPAEFADDHLPGAENFPVLSDAERVEIGTLHAQVSPFAARKRGAALVARNIAAHLLDAFQDKPLTWRPLIYCWRGGQRSGAMQIVLRQIGWKADQLEGGYKAWRSAVLADLERLPARLHFHVLCGPTGSAKTRLLHELAARGAQVLDLEALAAHKGSLLGPLPDTPQPSQRGFETRLWQALAGFAPERPVWVEAESRRIGRLDLPTALYARLHQGHCLEIDAPLAARVDFLLHDYAHFRDDPAAFCARLAGLAPHLGHARLARWQQLAERGDWQTLVGELLTRHYDPLYRRSRRAHFETPPRLGHLRLDRLDATHLAHLADTLLARADNRPTSASPSR